MMLRNIFHKAAEKMSWFMDEAGQFAKKTAQQLKDYFNQGLEEFDLLEKGIVHIGQASPDIQEEFRRDAATFSLESSLALAEDITLEATLAFAAIETGEKIFSTKPHHEIDLKEISASFVESVASSTVSAIHAAHNLYYDIERSGHQWKMAHPA
jgi:hypothetical protein